jgi:hypothetical protein
MGYLFTEEDIKVISDTIGIKPKQFEDSWTWNIKDPGETKPLIFTLYNHIDLGAGKIGSLLSVQTRHGYYELHNCTSFMPFEPDEIIFMQSGIEYLTCLIIGKQSTCSLFSNIKRELLKSDFSELHPAVLMSAMQLSITESILEN